MKTALIIPSTINSSPSNIDLNIDHNSTVVKVDFLDYMTLSKVKLPFLQFADDIEPVNGHFVNLQIIQAVSRMVKVMTTDRS